MSGALKNRIKQKTDFQSPAVEALLSLIVTADFVRGRQNAFFAKYNLTNGQYNVLRILRGAYPEGYASGEIAARMLENAPDVPRLTERLEAAALVSRNRLESDRRVSIIMITDKGLELLEEMQEEIEMNMQFYNELLSEQECRLLIEICEKIYTAE